jgi:hypothetical protein
MAAIASPSSDVSFDKSPYAPFIDNCKILLQNPVPTAKNPALQQELNKAHALYKKVIQDTIHTLGQLQVSSAELSRLYSADQPDDKAIEAFEAESSRLRDLADRYTEDLGEIEKFIEVLKVEDNPSSSARDAFCRWAQSTFSNS